MKVAAFNPHTATVNLAVTGTTGRVLVEANTYSHHVRIYNAGTVVVFVEFGDVTVTASTATSIPLPPGNVEVFGFAAGYVAAITTTGTATIYCTPGDGI